MKISELVLSDYKIKIKEGIKLQIGSFVFRIRLGCNQAIIDFYHLYKEYDILLADVFIDFDINIKKPRNLRRWIFPQVNFYLGEETPFKPLPATQAYAMLEWGMNWCIASRAHNYHILHAATVEKNGITITLPAESGSGKSTLCAALVYSGWRLFSDELTLVSLDNGNIYPCTRPINLKNNSINVIKELFPNIYNSRTAHDTHKGTVSLFAAPLESVNAILKHSKPSLVVFPKFKVDSDLIFEKMTKEESAFSIINNSFNYNILGEKGFSSVVSMVNEVDSYRFCYGNTEAAIKHFNLLAEKE